MPGFELFRGGQINGGGVTAAPAPTHIYVDARALQDPNYRFRGVGQHAASLLGALRRRDWGVRRPRLIAVTNVAHEELVLEHKRLFDEFSLQPRPGRGVAAADAWFLQLSPMTHDPVWAAAFLEHPAIYKVALFYDLIPLESPERYLASAAARMDYIVALAWLRRYDAFAAISRDSALKFAQRAAEPTRQIFVSGVALRPALAPLEGEETVALELRRRIVVAGGGDPRKNPECVLLAHAKSSVLRVAGITLSVIGNYPESQRAALRDIYARNGGQAAALSFEAHLSDDALRSLYRNAFAVVVPSFAEGFSIPIVEGSAAGAPVLASDLPVHAELLPHARWRFPPDKPDVLTDMLELLVTAPERWAAMQAEQKDIWRGFTPQRVGEAFAHGALERARGRPAAPALKRGARPRLAVLTPLPPAASGVADYSAASLRPLKSIVDLHMFTSTPAAIWEDGWASLAPVSAAAYSPRRFDAAISVMGNSDHHLEIFQYLRDHGGACIAHDARQIDFYYQLLGQERASKIASLELGEIISPDRVRGWLLDQRTLPTLFLSEIVGASDPLFVHSPTTAGEIKRLYGSSPTLLPFAQYRRIGKDRLGEQGRRFARNELQFLPEEIVVTSFGFVADDKAPQEIIWATRLLRDWGIPVSLAFCGSAAGMFEPLSQLVQELKLEGYVRLFEREIDENAYVNHLLASDVAVQLRTYGLGGLSGALNDCIAAGIPSVANEHLAAAMRAPSFVRRIPDQISSILIAEAILELCAPGPCAERPTEIAAAFAQAHSPEAYCGQLLKTLAIEAPDLCFT